MTAPSDPGQEQLSLPLDEPPGGDLAALRRRGVLEAAEVHVAEALGRLVGEDRPDVRLAIALAVRAPRVGDVCLDLARLAERGVVADDEDRVPLALPAPRAWREALEASPAIRVVAHEASTGARSRPAIADPAPEVEPLVLDGDRLYLDRYWRYETRLADRLRRLAGQRLEDRSEQEVEAALDRLFPPDGGEPDLQRQAAEVAAARALTVLSGGPGTGKTTTVVRLLATLLETGGDTDLRVVLAAPTGKAATRLGEAVRDALAASWPPLAPASRAALGEVPAMTLHRLLGFRSGAPSRFRHHARRPLPYDVVVVDEASMLSLPMAAKLLDALRDGARLVLVGDRDQLASVEAGAVLGELSGSTATTGALAGRVVQLTRFHRFGPDSGIGAVARAVQRVDEDAGEVLELLEGRRTERAVGEAYDDVARHDPTPGDVLPAPVRDRVLAAYRAVVDAARAGVDPAEVLSAFERQRVLCALRGGPQGVHAVNASLEAGLAEHGYAVRDRYPVGRPVMVTRNDYAVRLFNGDVGVVVRDPAAPDRRVVAFPAPEGGVRLLGTGRLPPHETVWAMSVHKSQGSQFDRVVMLLPDQASPVLSRELVYTGVTRASHRVDVVARRELLAAALVRSVPRASGLGARLSVT